MKMGPQEDYIETVFTCTGDFNDPNLQLQLEEFHEGLRSLLLSETCQEELILKKVEPWNSVRVTFNIPRAAALKLKQLAQQGDTSLRRLGVLAVQIEGDQSISLTIAGKNNERTELIFKTGIGETSSNPSTSMLDSTKSEATQQSLEYLRQSNALLDPLLNHLGAGGDLLQSPNVVATSSDPIPFLSAGITTVASVGKLPGLEHSPLQGLVFPPGRSPTGYPNSPSPSYIPMGHGKNVGHLPPKYSSYGHGRQGMATLPRQTIGNLVLPPPPAYEHPHVVSVNNVQKQNRPMTSSSPLLVNLLQNDPSGGLLNNLTQGKLPDLFDGTLEALALAKKKRRRKKKKRLAAEAAAREAAAHEAALLAEGIINTDITSTPALSLPGFNKAIKKFKFSSQSCGLPADHSTPLTEFGLETGAGKLVNPYTGLLESADEAAGEIAARAAAENAARASAEIASYTTQAPFMNNPGVKHQAIHQPLNNPEKIDTIQASIDRVADAWNSHVTSSDITTPTSTFSLDPLSFSSVSTPASFQSMVSPAGLPPHSLPCSTSTYLSPASLGTPSYSIGTSMDTLTSSSVCDRPSSDPLSRPYDINFTMINTNSVSSMAESLHRAPLLAMQHVTNSVGLSSSSSSPWHAGPMPPLSSTSHMQPQLSNTCMQDIVNPKLSHGVGKMPQIVGDHVDSVRSLALDKSRSFPSSMPGEGHHAPMRHHSRTPPHSKSGSLPMSYQVERPRSTGSYPLSRVPDDKGLAQCVSGIPPHITSVESSIANPLHATVSRYHNTPVQSMVQCVSTTGPSVKCPTPRTVMSFVNPAHIEVTNRGVLQTDMSRKGSDEINNSNHDSGLSSQSETTDDNHLTDETASSCGTQGSPPLNAAEGAAKVDQSHGKIKPIISKAAVMPTSAHNPVKLSGNPHYHKDMHVSTMVSSSGLNAPNIRPVVTTNPTVLHWNTRDGMVSAGTNINLLLSAAKDSQQGVHHQQRAPLQSTYDKELLANATCESPEHAKSLETVMCRDKLPHHVSLEGQSVSCHGEMNKLSVSIASMSEIRQPSIPPVMRDKTMVSMPSFRGQGYHTPGVPVSQSAGDAFGNYHRDVHLANPGPIMSSSVYHGPEGKPMGPKPFLQPSAIFGVPNLSDLRTSKLLDKSPSALPESRLATHSLRMKLHKTPAQNMLPVMSSSGIVRGHNPYIDSVPRLTAPVHHSVPTSTVNYSNSSLDSLSLCSNSHGVIPVSSASYVRTMSGPRSQLPNPALVHNHNENCRTSWSGSASVGSSEALKTLQNYINPVTVQMCNTTSSSMTSNLEAASSLVNSMSTVVTHDQLIHRPSYSHNTMVTPTNTSHSGHAQSQVQILHTEREMNGPVSIRENQDLQNCHVNDFLNDASDSLEASLVKCENSGLSSLPLISTETLDQELLPNCLPSELQVLDDRIDSSVLTSLASSERNVVQRGILSGGKSPGHSAALLSSSPDNLKGSNVTSMYTRKSPTAKSGGGLSMLSMFASDLPLPKLLTESMLKVVKPLPGGSAKDMDGSLKVARRNQAPVHTNLHSHNSSSPYSKSPPLSYDSVQGAGSVLTPPKSPVRFGQVDSLSVSSAKSQSPRSWNQHVSQTASNPSPQPPGSSISSPASILVSEQHHTTGEQSQHNGQDVPTANHVSDFSRDIGDNVVMTKTSFGASSIDSTEQTQPSADNKLMNTDTTAEVVSTPVIHSYISESNKMSEMSATEPVSTIPINQTESVQHQPPAVEQTIEQPSTQDHLDAKEQEACVEQELCKANESCQPLTSAMQPMSLPENTQTNPDHAVSEEITQTFPSPAEEPVLTDAAAELTFENNQSDIVNTQTVSDKGSMSQVDKESRPPQDHDDQQVTEGIQGTVGVQNIHPAINFTAEVTAQDVRNEHSYTGSNIGLTSSAETSVPVVENHIEENVSLSVAMHQTSNHDPSDHHDGDLTLPEMKSGNSNYDECITDQNTANTSDQLAPAAVNDVSTHHEMNDHSEEPLAVQDPSVVNSFEDTSTEDMDLSSETPGKLLKGAKQVEKEAVRPGRLGKTPKRKEEDNESKTSPENETSPQLRQRRSRRRLTENDGNGSEVAGIKRSKFDGQDDSLDHPEGITNEHESNDTGAKHNAVEDTHDPTTFEDGQLLNSHEHKAGPEDKNASRQPRKGPEASKPVLRDIKRDGKQNIAAPDNDLKGRGRGAERVVKANEDEHVTRSSRRNRLSPSTGPEKPGTQAARDRSPMRGARNKTPDQREESPEPQFKRTTRSTKPKEHTEPVTASNRRRRASRDHR